MISVEMICWGLTLDLVFIVIACVCVRDIYTANVYKYYTNKFLNPNYAQNEAKKLKNDNKKKKKQQKNDSQIQNDQLDSLRYWLLLAVILRLIFVAICAMIDGQLYFDFTPNINKNGSFNIEFILFLTYCLIEEISASLKLILLIIIFWRVTTIMSKLYDINIDTNSSDIQVYSHKTLSIFRFAGILSIILDIIDRIISITLWLFTNHTTASGKHSNNSKSSNDNNMPQWQVLYSLLMYVLQWIVFIIFVICFYKLKRKVERYYRIVNVNYKYTFGAYGSMHQTLEKLKILWPLFLVWFVIYLTCGAIDIFDKLWNDFVVSSSSHENDSEIVKQLFDIELYWIYWGIQDTIYFVALLKYLKPKIDPRIKQYTLMDQQLLLPVAD